MFALEVDLLTGAYVAAHPTDRRRVEWPPHPARLYSALVASWGEDGADAFEREVLEWLAVQRAPEIVCGSHAERVVVTHYVPANDAAAVKDHTRLYRTLRDKEQAFRGAQAGAGLNPRLVARAQVDLGRAIFKTEQDSPRLASAAGAPESSLQLLPDRRPKHARMYPAAIAEEPCVIFRWPDAQPTSGQRDLLDGIAARISRLGHSSSMVACRVVDDSDEVARYVPDPDGSLVLRAPAEGLLGLLEQEHARHQGRKPRSLPAALVAYRETSEVAEAPIGAPALGEDWIVLGRVGGARLPLTRALLVASTVRKALLKYAEDPVPELISGHQAPGSLGGPSRPTERPHLAIVPLPFVGHSHADGSLLGIALILPRDANDGDRIAVLRALAGWRDAGFDLHMGEAGAATLAMVDPLDPRTTLQPSTWCRPARTWATVTPVALDRVPRHLFRGTHGQRTAAVDQAAAVVARACAYAGLPLPAEVEVVDEGLIEGVAPRHAFPHYRVRGKQVQRVTVHGRLTFAAPVRGPVLIGAGRYLGYGLCRPVRTEPPK